MKDMFSNTMAYISWCRDFGVPLGEEQIRNLIFKEGLDGVPLPKILQRGENNPKVRRVKAIVPLLSKAIKTIDLNKSEHKARIRNSPWTRLPNVSEFKININGPNLLAKYFGITKQLPPIILTAPHKNRGMNRYMEHQIIRLEKARNEGKNTLYWRMAKALIKRSNIFRVAAINHVLPNWQRNYPLHLILHWNRKVSKLINDGESTMDFHRVYIEKGETYRPLGVPTVPWRIYLHMYNCFLTHFLLPKLNKNQHAYLPNKGTLTAWKQIFSQKLYNYKYIMEWDFKQFFPTIHANRITEELIKFGVTKEVAYFLENINRSNPQLAEPKLLDESKVEAQKRSQENFRLGVWKPTDKIFETIREMVSGKVHHNDRIYYDPKIGIENWKLLNDFMKESDCLDIFEYVQLQWALLDEHRPTKIEEDFNGVAQGAPTSPILANLIMNIWLNQQNNEPETVCVAYADDSVTFSNSPIKVNSPENKAPENTGIEIHEKKSGIVKRNGIWKGPLKFLGLKFDGKTFESETRTGKRLKFSENIDRLLHLERIRIEQGLDLSDKDSILQFIEKQEKDREDYWGSWSDLFKSKMMGFVQSRLYQGTWNLENLEQDFNYRFIHNSWADKLGYKYENINVFNSTSFACFSLWNILRWNSKTKKSRTIKRGGLPRNMIFKLKH